MVEQSAEGGEPAPPPRVFVSYAHDLGDESHGVAVRLLWEFLRSCGIDAQLDLPAAQRRRDWALWMADQIREADFVLVIASPAYRERAEGRGDPGVGRGVQWEARLIRDAFYRDQRALDRFVPVVLPGQGVEGVPDFLAPTTTTVYFVSDFTVDGANSLLRLLTAQPETIEPPLGPVPVLGPSPSLNRMSALRRTSQPRRLPPVVRNQITGHVSGTVIQTGSMGSVTLSGPSTPLTPAPEPPAHTVGAGLPGWTSTFQGLHAALRRRAVMTEPTTDVEPYGPGVRQEFSGGWVLCALPDRRAAAVADSVWEGLHVVGGGAVPPGPLEAVGFPVPGPNDPSTMIVDDDATHVELDGGTWGPGRLRRVDTAHEWEWEPESDNFSRTMTAVAQHWTGESPAPRLRIRAIASMNLVRSTDWEITAERRRRFEEALPNSDLARSLTRMSYGLTATEWTRRPRANYPDRARYLWCVLAPNGDLAVEAEVMVAALGPVGRPVVTCAELRVHDYGAWTAAIAAAGTATERARLTLPEVRDFLLAAWQMATGGLLDLLAFPASGLRWKEVPHVEFRLTAEDDPAGRRSQATVADLIDFAAFGPESDGQHTGMAVTIPAVPRLPDQLRQTLTRQALAYLGRNFGYLDATVDRL